MKRKAKRPAQSPNTMPPERLVPIFDSLLDFAVQLVRPKQPGASAA